MERLCESLWVGSMGIYQMFDQMTHETLVKAAATRLVSTWLINWMLAGLRVEICIEGAGSIQRRQGIAQGRPWGPRVARWALVDLTVPGLT